MTTTWISVRRLHSVRRFAMCYMPWNAPMICSHFKSEVSISIRYFQSSIGWLNSCTRQEKSDGILILPWVISSGKRHMKVSKRDSEMKRKLSRKQRSRLLQLIRDLRRMWALRHYLCVILFVFTQHSLSMETLLRIKRTINYAELSQVKSISKLNSPNRRKLAAAQQQRRTMLRTRRRKVKSLMLALFCSTVEQANRPRLKCNRLKSMLWLLNRREYSKMGVPVLECPQLWEVQLEQLQVW